MRTVNNNRLITVPRNKKMFRISFAITIRYCYTSFPFAWIGLCYCSPNRTESSCTWQCSAGDKIKGTSKPSSRVVQIKAARIKCSWNSSSGESSDAESDGRRKAAESFKKRNRNTNNNNNNNKKVSRNLNWLEFNNKLQLTLLSS